jgi:hypothetical protein
MIAHAELGKIGSETFQAYAVASRRRFDLCCHRSAAAATTATAATATLAKPTSATTSAITSVAPLDDIQLHQYVRVCLRRLLSRWWPRLTVSDLLFRYRLLRLSPSCSVPAAVPAIAAVPAVPAAAPALAATTITSAISNKAAIATITATIISDGTRITGQVSCDD